MKEKTFFDTETINQLVSAIKSGAIIDPMGDSQFKIYLEHPEVVNALKSRQG